MSPLLTALLLALRANCEATICAIDLCLAMTEPKEKSPESPAPDPPPQSETGGECLHPNLIHAPVMGNQGRFLCQNPKCQAEVSK